MTEQKNDVSSAETGLPKLSDADAFVRRQLSDEERSQITERLRDSDQIETLHALMSRRLAEHSFEFLLGELTSHAAAIAGQRISAVRRGKNSPAVSKEENALLNQQSFDLMREHYNKLLRRVPELELNLRRYLIEEFILFGLLECEQELGSEILKLSPAELAARITDLFSNTGELGIIQIITDSLNIPADMLAHAPMNTIDPDQELFAPIRTILDPEGASREESGGKKRAEELKFLFSPDSGAKEEVIFGMRTRLPLADHLSVSNSTTFHKVRELLFKKSSFRKVDYSPWPTSNFLSGSQHDYAQFLPVGLENSGEEAKSPTEMKELAEKMHAQIAELDDLDADVLDMLSHFWLRVADQNKNKDTDARVTIDQLLEKRGLLPKLSGNNRRGGYSQNQRDAVNRALEHIQNLWLTIAEVNFPGKSSKKPGSGRPQLLQSRAFMITDRVVQENLPGEFDTKAIVFRPGNNFAKYLFGPGRQTALLSIKALQYDPKRRAPEKRLTRYFSWQWRIRARSGTYLEPYKINTILEAVDIQMTGRNDARKRERIEDALDQLQSDGIIANWEYKIEINGPKWGDSLVMIEPPTDFVDYYSEIGQGAALKAFPAGKSPAAAGGQNDLDKIAAQVRAAREALKQSVLQAAENIKITEKQLLALESRSIGKAELKRIRPKLDKWIKQHPAQKLLN